MSQRQNAILSETNQTRGPQSTLRLPPHGCAAMVSIQVWKRNRHGEGLKHQSKENMLCDLSPSAYVITVIMSHLCEGLMSELL